MPARRRRAPSPHRRPRQPPRRERPPSASRGRGSRRAKWRRSRGVAGGWRRRGRGRTSSREADFTCEGQRSQGGSASRVSRSELGVYCKVEPLIKGHAHITKFTHHNFSLSCSRAELPPPHAQRRVPRLQRRVRRQRRPPSRLVRPERRPRSAPTRRRRWRSPRRERGDVERVTVEHRRRSGNSHRVVRVGVVRRARAIAVVREAPPRRRQQLGELTRGRAWRCPSLSARITLPRTRSDELIAASFSAGPPRGSASAAPIRG